MAMSLPDARQGGERLLLSRGAILIVSIALGACAPVSSGGEKVDVALIDFEISADPTSVPSGVTDFAITNDGSMVHEVEIFAGADPDRSLDVSNSVADTTGLDLIDEVEDILPSSTARLAVDLEPGTYLVICNLPGHYEQGMSTYLTVGGSVPSSQP